MQFCAGLTTDWYSTGDILTQHFVHIHHVEIYPAQLHVQKVWQCPTSHNTQPYGIALTCITNGCPTAMHALTLVLRMCPSCLIVSKSCNTVSSCVVQQRPHHHTLYLMHTYMYLMKSTCTWKKKHIFFALSIHYLLVCYTHVHVADSV